MSENGRLRIGLGYDMHRFVSYRRLVLGGIEIENPEGLLGHSDADVVAHAVMDAVLGAMREGDIGELFPDTDQSLEGASSIELLGKVAALASERGFELLDADCVIVLERPKVCAHREDMRRALAEALGVGVELVGLKATTTEGLGATGRREGAGAYAVVLMEGPAR